MKILFVTRGFPSERNPMDGNYEAVQAKAIAAKGHQVSLIAIREKSLRSFCNWMRLSCRKVDDINVYEGINISTNIRFLRRINKYLRRLSYRRAFKRCVKEEGIPDIVHAHIVSIAYHAFFLKKDYHLPFVVTEHWTKMNVSDVSKLLCNMSDVYHKADKVICVSQALSDSLKRNFQVDSIVVNNMVSDLFFKSSRIERNDNIFRFIAVGAFRKNKGFDLLVDAFAKGNFQENVTLDIVGDGEEREVVESKIRQYDLSGQIHLLGTKTPEEVSKLLCDSDCFVLSSRLETFAIVVIEALAKGVPVIATKCGGPETFLRPEHGLLVDKENVEQLASAMEQMIEHHSCYDGDIIKTFCRDNFSQNVIADKIIDVYKQILLEQSHKSINSER